MKTRSVELLAELSQELADMQTLVKAYEMQHRNDKARIAVLETEVSVAIYDKLRWQAQAKRHMRPVLVGTRTNV